MAYKIVVDSGHGGEDPGAVYPGRQEKEDTLRLALEVGRLLEAGGQDVVYTRTTDVYQTPFEKAQMAEAINGALEEVGFRNLGVKERPGLVVLRRTNMPALLVEAGFINNDQDNQLFDEKFTEIAGAISEAILGTLDQETVEDPLLYRVQVGVFRNKENADRLNYELLDKGYPSYILQQDGYYKVQVGAFEQLGNAVLMEQRLRKDGYQTLITTR